MLYWFSSHFFPSPADIVDTAKVSCPDSVDSHPAAFCRARACLSGKTGCPKRGILSLSGALLRLRPDLLSGFAKILHPSFIATCGRIFFLLPHFLLYSLLQMRHSRYFIPDTHMRSAMVIEMYVASYDISCMPENRGWLLSAFNPVDTFRNGIVGGFVVFRHTDGNAMFLKKCHVWVATVLYATVRVMRKIFISVISTACSIACCNALMVADTGTHPTILWE